MLSQQRDGNGDRIKGLPEIDPAKAEVVGRIFKMYADGVSPNDIAEILTKETVPGPRESVAGYCHPWPQEPRDRHPQQ
jgi:hypothetical protein